MPLINWKIELKLRWTNYCVFSAAADNANDNANNIIFTIIYSCCYFMSKRQLKIIKTFW